MNQCEWKPKKKIKGERAIYNPDAEVRHNFKVTVIFATNLSTVIVSCNLFKNIGNKKVCLIITPVSEWNETL